MTTPLLHHRTLAPEADAATPLVLLHGLFGSSANWGGVAKRLASDRRVLMPDLRNHGRSLWAAPMDYPEMAADLVRLLDATGIDRAHLVGHSMGGKAAMWLALCAPRRVARLAVVDIAPVAYTPRFGEMIAAMRALPLAEIGSRGDADARLAAAIPSPSVRGYLLQSLYHEPESGWRWRINLDLIAESMPAIFGFPDLDGRQFTGSTLFLYGSRSEYVSGTGLAAIRACCPFARLRAVPNAGHWVYADQPGAFVNAVSAFLHD
jgi:esterase